MRRGDRASLQTLLSTNASHFASTKYVRHAYAARVLIPSRANILYPSQHPAASGSTQLLVVPCTRDAVVVDNFRSHLAEPQQMDGSALRDPSSTPILRSVKAAPVPAVTTLDERRRAASTRTRTSRDCGMGDDDHGRPQVSRSRRRRPASGTSKHSVRSSQ